MRIRHISVLAILALVALIYWPVRHGGFVWDDQLCFHDAAWLRSANWIHYLFRDFCDWKVYFRPLGILLFVGEIRAFDAAPGPMHLVSLFLHIINTALVGLLARRLTRARVEWAGPCAMLCYGLHPALVEPIAWASCQFDLMLVLLTLLGLWFNLSLRDGRARAFAVALCFFAASCAKEPAAVFPALLVLFDGFTSDTPRLRTLWRRQSGVYAAVFVAGLAYLALRRWALGFLIPPVQALSATPIAWLQEICLTYVSYWKTILWPMTGAGPIHPVEVTRLAALSPSTLAVDAIAAAVLGFGLYSLWKGRLAGYWIAAVTAALLPVLNLAPVAFTESLYHERYAMTAIAITCALLPALLAPALARERVARLALPAIAVFWLALAIINVRVTLPLWNDEQTLWQWALRENPGSLLARDRLLYFYVTRGDRVHARELADALVAENAPCPACMLNAALVAIADGDAERAARALHNLDSSADALADNPRLLHEYVYINGKLLQLRGDLVGAEDAYRDAITLDPLDPLPHWNLALLLATQGQTDAARKAADAALALFTPDQREARSTQFEQALTRRNR